MDTRDAGRKGGQSRSAAKRAASTRNLELARRIHAQMAETETWIADLKEKGIRDLTAERFLEDARVSIANLETPGYKQTPVVLFTPKASN